MKTQTKYPNPTPTPKSFAGQDNAYEAYASGKAVGIAAFLIAAYGLLCLSLIALVFGASAVGLVFLAPQAQLAQYPNQLQVRYPTLPTQTLNCSPFTAGFNQTINGKGIGYYNTSYPPTVMPSTPVTSPRTRPSPANPITVQTYGTERY